MSSKNGKEETEIRALIIQLLKDYPDYDFAKFNMIEILIREKDYEGASKILGDTRRAEHFFKDEIIHISAFRSFQLLAVQIDIEEGKLDSAEERLNWIDDVEPDNDLTITFRHLILLKRMEKMKERMDESKKMTRTVSSFPTVSFEQTAEMIPLQHSAEFSSFYDTKWTELPDNFGQILALPHPSLIKDLENILIDSIQRSDYIENEESIISTSFPLHAARFLGFLENESSLDIILNIFRQGKDYLEFWYGEIIESFFRPVLFKLAKTKKEWDKLAQFLLEENIHFETKNIVSDVFKDLILTQKYLVRKAEQFSGRY
ncbi:MAG: hypothetical protein HC803_08190 [Saprospiraceae bacterium]|nr:hypothetical protein [Saprospiraceae bacterium]